MNLASELGETEKPVGLELMFAEEGKTERIGGMSALGASHFHIEMLREKRLLSSIES